MQVASAALGAQVNEEALFPLLLQPRQPPMGSIVWHVPHSKSLEDHPPNTPAVQVAISLLWVHPRNYWDPDDVLVELEPRLVHVIRSLKQTAVFPLHFYTEFSQMRVHWRGKSVVNRRMDLPRPVSPHQLPAKTDGDLLEVDGIAGAGVGQGRTGGVHARIQGRRPSQRRRPYEARERSGGNCLPGPGRPGVVPLSQRVLQKQLKLLKHVLMLAQEEYIFI